MLAPLSYKVVHICTKNLFRQLELYGLTAYGRFLADTTGSNGSTPASRNRLKPARSSQLDQDKLSYHSDHSPTAHAASEALLIGDLFVL